jgi:hypothetical protein
VLFSNPECAAGIEFMPIRGAFYTHVEVIDRRKMMKLPINVQKLPLDVQAYEQSAEENHSEVGGDGSELPPC